MSSGFYIHECKTCNKTFNSNSIAPYLGCPYCSSLDTNPIHFEDCIDELYKPFKDAMKGEEDE